jgi:thiamine biosynthesis lipoprotein
VDQVVTLVSGGLATSGTTARSWVRNGRTVHHIVDPWTGDAAPAVWALASITAPSCVQANAWSTAAIVWGLDAIGNLAAIGVPARLVHADGNIVRLGGWPPAADDLAGSGRHELLNHHLDTGTSC